MGLLSVIHKARRNEREIRLLLVGLDNAGKTTVVKRICGEDITTVSPTLGFEIRTVEFEGFRLSIWDVGGQRSLRAYWRNYFESTDVLVWVVDSADARRLQDCAQELANLLREERLAGATLLVLANKQDVVGALTPDRIQQVLGLGAMGRRHWKVVGCSAATGGGLDGAFQWAVADVSARVALPA